MQINIKSLDDIERAPYKKFAQPITINEIPL